MDQSTKYQLIRKIAQGGMAEVFLGRVTGPHGFEKAVVVKRMLPELADDQGCVDMFLSEARVSAKLNHPNIVQIFDFGQADGAYFIAMEFIDGPNLRAVVRRAKGLSPAIVAKLISVACDGLAYAHDFTDPISGRALGLIHRDVSPENIMLTKQGSVKLVDFGIVKATSEASRTRIGTVKGKVAYMAPEQIRGEVLDRRTDIYALGVTLFELLTGHRPHELQNEIAMMHAILTDPPQRLSVFRQDVPDAMQKIIDKALSKRREDRYASCRDLQMDLDRFLLRLSVQVGSAELSEIANQVMAVSGSPTPATSVPGLVLGGAADPAAPVEQEDLGKPAFNTGALTTPVAKAISESPKATPHPPSDIQHITDHAIEAMAADPAPPASTPDDEEDDREPPTIVVPSPAQERPELREASRIALGVIIALALVVGGSVAVMAISSDFSGGVANPLKKGAKASLHVECNLPCKARINDQSFGEATPLSPLIRVAEIPAGPVRIEVSNESITFGDIPSFTKTVSQVLQPGENGTLRLYVKTGKVDFSKLPDGLTVTISGKTLGTTPLPVTEMYEGRHLVQLGAATTDLAGKAFELTVVPDVTIVLSPP